MWKIKNPKWETSDLVLFKGAKSGDFAQHGEVDLRISTIQELSKGLEVHPQELFDFKIE